MQTWKCLNFAAVICFVSAAVSLNLICGSVQAEATDKWPNSCLPGKSANYWDKATPSWKYCVLCLALKKKKQHFLEVLLL